MKVFLSWHGARSRAVAEALNDWLRRVIQAVKPFFSPEIEKGAKWSSEIDSALEGTRFGIVCLTPDNLDSSWIHYEAGALSKTKDALIWTFLHGLTQGDVPQPLGKFQHTLATKGDTLRLLRTINSRLADVGGEPLGEQLLDDNFELFWPQLEARLKDADKIPLAASKITALDKVEPTRGERAILNEILELVRNQERRLNELDYRADQFPRGQFSRSETDRITHLEVDIVSDALTPKEFSEKVRIALLPIAPQSAFHAIRRTKAGKLRVIVQLSPPVCEFELQKALADFPTEIMSWSYF